MRLRGVHTLRTLEDSQAIREAAKKGAKVVLIGGGFIGVEVAASLRQLGAAPTVLEKTARILGEISNPDASDFIVNVCRDKGVQFHVNADVAEVEGDERPNAVRTADGKRYECDLVVVAVGIQPNIELAREAGLALEGNGVRVDAHMRTSDPDIYAAGDIANYPDPWFDHRRRVEHWGQAEYTGGLAGRNMAGKQETYDLVTYIWSDIFDLHLEFSGWSKAADATQLRGKPGDKNGFIVLYLKNHVLKAYLAVNAPKDDYQPLETLIKKRVDVSEHLTALTDPATQVKGVVESTN
jgi:NADPH-dependent 2,4-dienoyl-CoA reductase/sulfur reductase-like enzyme